ncbi:protein rigor mortis-like isoform X2 [Topomyia yanbarensis]|uniref:protein rigor mortis-like isoform X2 n=1 Tax=Topomyia yanbarensis TaxID=2498891 RepID=UPI00273CDDFF|nr:protein rigor mortis-like isoform X2 [Topomyia yanbarensis]
MDMNTDGFVVPNMQAWFRQNSFMCTPDNGLLYQSRADINYIAPLVNGQLPKVRIINAKTTIKALACSPDWTEGREFATYDDQHAIQVWDLDKGESVKGHKGHQHWVSSRSEKNIEVNSAICYTHAQKIVSVDHSVLIVYCLVTNSYKTYADFFRENSVIVVLSPCPYERDIFAAGLKNGLIKIVSLHKMTVLYNLRGHDKEIVSLDWMKVSVLSKPPAENWRREERPKKEARKKRDKKVEESPKPTDTSTPAVDTSDIFDIYEYNEQEEEFGTIVDRTTSTFDQRDRYRENIHTTEGFNFLEACQNLKEDIIKAKQEDEAAEDESGQPADDETEGAHALNTDDENELDEAEKLRDFIIVDGEGKEKRKSGSEEESEEEQKEEGTPRIVLASSSRENIIHFWNYYSGVSIDKVSLPNSNVSKRLCPGTFITAVWLNESKIVANSITGNVFEWKVSFYFQGPSIRMKATRSLKHYPVDAAIYVVRAMGPIADYDPKVRYIWCQSLNRKFLAVSTSEKPEIVADLACLAIGNTCVVENPMESTVLAIGCTDRRLVTLNLASMAYNEVTGVPFMNKVSSKVTALDWHPERENIIAFGTSEGRVGMLDTNNQINVPVLLPSFLSTDVYSLKWSEITDDMRVRQTVLFATGKAKMAYYKMKPGKHEMIEMHQCGMVSSVSASEQYLFVGTQDGFVYVNDLSKNLAQLYRRSITRRYITSMQFKDNILAVASNENSIRLIDFSSTIDDNVDDNIRLLDGHSKGVCCLRWGYGDSKLLVSGGFDSSVRVWDTINRSCIAVYNSVDSVYCAIFSPINENIIILTGKGTTLAFIDYTKHPPLDKSTVKSEAAEEKVEPTTRSEESKEEEEKFEKTDAQVDELADQLKQVKFKEIKPIQLKSNVPTTFHLSNREINKPIDVLECIIRVANFKEPDDDEDQVDEDGDASEKVEPKSDEPKYFNEKLFTSEKNLRDLIAEETKNHHDGRTSSIGTILLPQIGFRLKEEIVERIASRTLTDQLVALAPSISYEFWRKCCEAYGYQFLEKQYALASIPYFLASHKITEAIDYLCKHKFFREAWAICKLRKDSDDPIRAQVSTEWAQYLETVGNLEGAALVWTAAKQYKNAIAALSKRKEITEHMQRAIDELNAKLQEAAE